MSEKLSHFTEKVAGMFHHDHSMYDDPNSFGEQPYGVPGERIVEIENVPPKAADDEYMLTEMTSETGKIAALASELQVNGHVVGVAKASYNKVRVFVGRHPHEVAGAFGIAATIGTGIILHGEFKRRKEESTKTE
ncbi:MAG: hypothetical protein HYV40_05410 [Candidatus Levybacteria bacterium]|nr:hypothetical protein [Candidatus Levybacteria bacterium]